MNTIRKNPIFVFMINRYLSYGLLIIRGLIIAKFLGPYYFGIWGFLNLILQYLQYSTFGINYAITVQLSTKAQNDKNINGQFSSIALILTVYIDLIIIIIGLILHFSGVKVFPRYEFDRYLIIILLIACLANIQQVLINIYRVYKNILRIASIEISSAIILLISAIYFKEDKLIATQLITMFLTGIISLAILLYRLPFKFKFQFDMKKFKTLLLLGFSLLIYNFSFYFVTISARTVVSVFYSVEILGFFTLASTIAYATLLGLQSAAWAVYPAVLSRTTLDMGLESVRKTVYYINQVYNTACFLLVFIITIFLPVLFIYIPKYSPALPLLTIMLISQVILSISFGFNTLAVSRNEQQKVANIGLGIILLITLFSIVISLLHIKYTWIAFSILVGSIIYTILQVKLGKKLLESKKSLIIELKSMFPIGVIVAMVISIFGSFTELPALYSSIALGVFVISNLQSINELLKFIISKF